MATGSGNHQSIILFVDDNAALLRSVERLLTMEGYGVMLAADGRDAMQQLEQGPAQPDLIISDITMPGMDGFQFYKELRKHNQWMDIPFIFLTARDQIKDLEEGYLLGADNYLVKPLDQDRLLWIVRGRLKRRDELQARIRAQEKALKEVERDLATMVAHELRTPLVSITMVSDILAREMDLLSPEQVREMLDAMQSGQVRLHRLVEQMVMFVEMRSGVLEATVRDMCRIRSLRELLNEALSFAQRMDYRQRSIPIREERENPDVIIQCDFNSLRQAVGEVLLNAIAYSKPDGEILVSQWATAQWTSIAITDYGAGLPDSEWQRV
ncbi:MAG: hybrid sensor histidine kinase/response regulator, partial [Chloroflexi bacterium]